MADYVTETKNEGAEVIAKEITLEAMKMVYRPDEPTPENTGDQYGKLFKRILKHVREAMHNQKYD